MPLINFFIIIKSTKLIILFSIFIHIIILNYNIIIYNHNA
jgi:hypothetical protein